MNVFWGHKVGEDFVSLDFWEWQMAVFTMFLWALLNHAFSPRLAQLTKTCTRKTARHLCCIQKHARVSHRKYIGYISYIWYDVDRLRYFSVVHWILWEIQKGVGCNSTNIAQQSRPGKNPRRDVGGLWNTADILQTGQEKTHSRSLNHLNQRFTWTNWIDHHWITWTKCPTPHATWGWDCLEPCGRATHWSVWPTWSPCFRFWVRCQECQRVVKIIAAKLDQHGSVLVQRKEYEDEITRLTWPWYIRVVVLLHFDATEVWTGSFATNRYDPQDLCWAAGHLQCMSRSWI